MRSGCRKMLKIDLKEYFCQSLTRIDRHVYYSYCTHLPMLSPHWITPAQQNMATEQCTTKRRTAKKEHLRNEQFSDLAIVRKSKEFKVHRCLTSVYSGFFKSCCSGILEVGMHLVFLNSLALLKSVRRKLKRRESSIRKNYKELKGRRSASCTRSTTITR